MVFGAARPPPPSTQLQNVVSRMATTWACCYQPSPPPLLHVLLPLLVLFCFCLFVLLRAFCVSLSPQVRFLAGCLQTPTELISGQRMTPGFFFFPCTTNNVHNGVVTGSLWQPVKATSRYRKESAFSTSSPGLEGCKLRLSIPASPAVPASITHTHTHSSVKMFTVAPRSTPGFAAGVRVALASYSSTLLLLIGHAGSGRHAGAAVVR